MNTTHDPGKQRALRVLLVEDNPVNQRLATALLQRRGVAVTLATNGREAVEAWSSARFDAILMDIQMPEMDGLDATRAIRAAEEAGHHVPIIATTARAIPGDRDRCLEAGMDDYIGKPLRAATLMETIEQLITAGSPGPAATGGAEGASAKQDRVLDTHALRQLTGDDDALASELMTLFQGDAPTYLRQLRGAIAAANAVEVQRNAHALKGAARAICAAGVAQAALTLEDAARIGLLEDASTMADALAVQLTLLDAAIASMPLSESAAFPNKYAWSTS